MQLVTFPLAALALLGATGAPTSLQQAAESRATMREIQTLTPSPEQCRDRITQVRESTGKPPLLDRAPASPERPHRIYAVDKRIDGCAVMVMHGDVSDIRPLPARPEGPVLQMPARGSGQ
ncbi:hypothetical protein OIK40_01315 [Erythrobacter sp. sf7]|uniref:Uncharacterized protein n=1 Tax=Erythrobacter fulvus TaxID=2987523 RepID=A0ABT5JL92_9SPHN|nr:hypothetical protein [Erythrobacter fulvus]MDC8753276.1 hypothetical protein [Erythrobacter fulvus]